MMPLAYDDIPGSWGMYSKDWPAYHCADEEHALRAFVACTKEYVVPYGSYVKVGNDIRVETPELLAQLTEHMANIGPESTQSIIDRVNAAEAVAATAKRFYG